MSNIEVPAVAFAFLGPDALRIFLEIKNFHVSVFTGDEDSLNFRYDRPSTNIVILPNFAKRSQLAPYAEHIGHLICLTNGHHEPLVELDVPILDAIVDGDSIRRAARRAPHYYTDRIVEASVGLPLAAAPQEAEPENKEPASIDDWFTLFDQTGVEDLDFDRDIEYPVCQYVMGELSRQDLRGALKRLVKAGIPTDHVKPFYLWLTNQYGDKISKATKQYLTTENASAEKIAKKLKVAPIDLELLENIWIEMQAPTTEEEEND